jgi:hypothetical protein
VTPADIAAIEQELIAPASQLRDTRSMPRIRMLTRTDETAILTTFADPSGGPVVRVDTDEATGAPTAVTIAAISGDVALEKIKDDGASRSWLGVVDGVTKQVETSGGYPGMAASELG